MRVPMSWLRELVALPEGVSGRDVAAVLIRAGLEVETVEAVGGEVTGPVVTGRVLEVEEFTASNGKAIRWCQVEVGEAEPRGIVCGARNFAVGDVVVVTLPGAVLPGGFTIAARRTYGHVSDGMIASVRELGIGDEHDGILVLAQSTPVGADALEVLGMRDEVLDIAVTPDRGYCLSIRGVAREAATGYGVAFTDPALAVPAFTDTAVRLPEDSRSVPDDAAGGAHPGSIADPTAADRLVLRTVRGVDPTASTPSWMAARLRACGMRPVSLSVDITNYVMLELGQPLHAFDRAKLTGPLVVRRAAEGEPLETLDHVARRLDPEDVVVADGSGALALAGTMGGRHCEVDETSSELVVEAAHFSAVAVARQSRRHRLSSEASRRFERGVDPALPEVASARAVALLVELAGAQHVGTSHSGAVLAPAVIEVAADRASRTAGMPIATDDVVGHLLAVGCQVEVAGPLLRVTPPSWRPDLTDPADLDEEVLRLEGYETLPSTLPHPPAGRGLTPAQRRRRRVSVALAAAGYVEAPAYPFVGESAWDQLGLPAQDPRRQALRLANPLSDEEPLLRTTLLPGLLRTLVRNVGRGQTDVAVSETGMVFLPDAQAPAPPRLGVDRPPTADELAALEAALPHQPRHVAVALTGTREPAGWWGPARASSWSDAVAAARTVADALHVALKVRPAAQAPWHPGRCAVLLHDGVVVGHAGELHPRVVAAMGLPSRTSAMELDLDALVAASPEAVAASAVSTYPVAKEDVALVVADDVLACDVEAALREGAGELLESLRLFDVYTGVQLEEGKRSLAYSLRFRADDRTLTPGEAAAARDAAVARATARTGAVLRA